MGLSSPRRRFKSGWGRGRIIIVDKTPKGIFVFAFLNTFLFGLLPLFVFTKVLFDPRLAEMFVEKLKVSLSQEGSYEVFRWIFVAQLVIAFIFFLLGVGLFFKKEWARRATVYFSFLLLVLTVVAVFANPSQISHILLNAIYPAILIFYLTNKRIEGYFNR